MGDIGLRIPDLTRPGRIYEGPSTARDFWNGASPNSDNPAGGAVRGATPSTRTGDDGDRHARHLLYQGPTLCRQGVPLISGSPGRPPSTTSTPRERHVTSSRDRPGAQQPNNRRPPRLHAPAAPDGPLRDDPPDPEDVAAQITAGQGIFNPPRTLTFAAGTHVGRWFSPSGVVTRRGPTPDRWSAAPTTQRATIPNQAGSWYLISGGSGPDPWIPENAATTLNVRPPIRSARTLRTARRSASRPATRRPPVRQITGRSSASKVVHASSSASTTWTTQHSTIPRSQATGTQSPRGSGWLLVPAAGTTLRPSSAAPGPHRSRSRRPSAKPLVPARHLHRPEVQRLRIPAGTATFTIASCRPAPTSRYSTLPVQSGRWYYIINGLWESYWIRETSATTLEDSPRQSSPNP